MNGWMDEWLYLCLLYSDICLISLQMKKRVIKVKLLLFFRQLSIFKRQFFSSFTIKKINIRYA